MSRIKAVLDSFAAALDLKATEIRTGITLIEAVAVNEFENELWMVANTEQERADLREIAIEAGKLGIAKASELQPMIRAHYLAVYRFQKLGMDVERYIKEFERETQ